MSALSLLKAAKHINCVLNLTRPGQTKADSFLQQAD